MNKIAVFKGKKLRRTIHENEWWFSVADIIEALTGSDRSIAYWTAMKARVNHTVPGARIDPYRVCTGLARRRLAPGY